MLESRNLAQKPEFSAEAVQSGQYMRSWDVFFNDQFPRRDAFTELNMRVNQMALGQDVYKDVYVAPDGYLLTKVEQYTKADADKNCGACE
nr:DHHW family protein [Listeria rocourtiae]